jgi:hypothetical protein
VGPDTRLGLIDVMPKLCGFGGIDVNKKILLEYLKPIGSRITLYRQGVARGYVEGSSEPERFKWASTKNRENERYLKES